MQGKIKRIKLTDSTTNEVKYEFAVEINRNIVADVFNEFNGYFSSAIEFLSDKIDNDNNKIDNDNNKIDNDNKPNIQSNGAKVIADMIANKQSSLVVGIDELKEEIVRYAFPKMLQKPNDLTYAQATQKADEIIAYLIETNLLSFFADNIETLLWEGFIMAKDEKKPTATMTME